MGSVRGPGILFLSAVALGPCSTERGQSSFLLWLRGRLGRRHTCTRSQSSVCVPSPVLGPGGHISGHSDDLAYLLVVRTWPRSNKLLCWRCRCCHQQAREQSRGGVGGGRGDVSRAQGKEGDEGASGADIRVRGPQVEGQLLDQHQRQEGAGMPEDQRGGRGARSVDGGERPEVSSHDSRPVQGWQALRGLARTLHEHPLWRVWSPGWSALTWALTASPAPGPGGWHIQVGRGCLPVSPPLGQDVATRANAGEEREPLVSCLQCVR